MSIMLFALLCVGALLFWQGKFSFGNIQTEGRHVKAAGVMLMLPAASFILLSFILGMVFGTNQSALPFILTLLTFFQLVMMIVGVIVAYILIADPPNAPHLPGILGDIQNERHGKPSEPPPSGSRPKTPQQTQARHPLDMFMSSGNTQPKKVPTIMSVKEAAIYMGVTPDAIMGLIDDGKLPAARDNGGFRIARSVLDELKDPSAIT